MEKKDKKKKDDKKKQVPVCEENKYIQDKRIKKGTGLSENARIIME